MILAVILLILVIVFLCFLERGHEKYNKWLLHHLADAARRHPEDRELTRFYMGETEWVKTLDEDGI